LIRQTLQESSKIHRNPHFSSGTIIALLCISGFNQKSKNKDSRLRGNDTKHGLHSFNINDSHRSVVLRYVFPVHQSWGQNLNFLYDYFICHLYTHDGILSLRADQTGKILGLSVFKKLLIQTRVVLLTDGSGILLRKFLIDKNNFNMISDTSLNVVKIL
jgi:hypothetical protein